MKRLLLALLLALAALPASAIRPDEILSDPALETRARHLGKELRCLVCQNQSIDDSEADLARDLRKIVRERLVAGDSDPEIRRFLVARYGDFVRLDPPLRLATAVLWFGPAVMLALGLLGIVLFLRRRPASDVPALDEADRARIERVLAEDDKR
ncbi:MAG: cytochrome c-type biogenesis protein CcmH [Alphaproteobacteria bacterium]|nr:cytochrome c-type biogenesis protein CcmH [Alphaproteobacteria bacterium]